MSGEIVTDRAGIFRAIRSNSSMVAVMSSCVTSSVVLVSRASSSAMRLESTPAPTMRALLFRLWAARLRCSWSPEFRSRSTAAKLLMNMSTSSRAESSPRASASSAMALLGGGTGGMVAQARSGALPTAIPVPP